MPPPPLPIDEVLPQVRAALREHPSVVLQAPPGAGKTTRVPTALLEEPWLAGRRIVMLEPRRLAARAAARHMASLRGERPGQTVGYRVRMDTQVGPETRVEVVTEGVLTRRVQRDMTLEGIGCVIFDEFHERSLQADLGLALCLEVQGALRPDLRLVVMSATLDAEPVARLLGDAPLVTSRGRSYPVETHYADRRPDGWIEPPTAATVRRALAERPEGDVLVFLPGEAEIRRTEERLTDPGLPPDVWLAPLYGRLSQHEQDRAIRPSEPGRRKVVLATAIAETSLTIEGVHTVVDSGLMRRPRFDPQSGMTRLVTRPVSQASADQRRGRAGRLGPGACYRLWPRAEQQHLRPHTPPEIAAADLAPLALELACWGTADPAALRWLDPPPAGAYAQARDLLHALDALDADGAVTRHGRRMNRLGVHPRLAHMMLRARDRGHGALACDLAALVGERDVLRGTGRPADADVRLRLEVLRDTRRSRAPAEGAAFHHHRVHRGALRHALRLSRHWRRRLRLPDEEPVEIEAAGLVLAFAYPDRIAQQRSGRPGHFRLRNGRAATFSHPQLLEEADYLVAAHLGGDRRERRVYLAAPLTLDELFDAFGEGVEAREVVTWDGEAQRVRARRQEHLGALVLKDGPLADPDPARLAAALADGVREQGLDLLPWTAHTRRLRERMAFMHHHDPAWPDVGEQTLRRTVHGWLAPHLFGLRRADELRRLDLAEILRGRLSWEQRRILDRDAPTHVEVPSGSRRPIDYSDPAAPVLAVRLQEMFGLTETPRIAGGHVPLTLHLLSPAQRPVQVTQDLASFWRDAYFDVKKDMKGRYPKHYWPEDPLEATPTHRVRPR